MINMKFTIKTCIYHRNNNVISFIIFWQQPHCELIQPNIGCGDMCRGGQADTGVIKNREGKGLLLNLTDTLKICSLRELIDPAMWVIPEVTPGFVIVGWARRCIHLSICSYWLIDYRYLGVIYVTYILLP